jgi:demethylmenaquinone methyltransferase/2-methoxy-6-polyprenyl-1,4-benzoquinol methylase
LVPEEKRRITQAESLDMTDGADYVRKLIVTAPLREPVIHSAIETLGFPRGSRGLDAGCGIGLHTVLLAEAVGPAGHVTGLDVASGFLSHAEKAAERAGLSSRICFRQGDIYALPFDDDTFDWVWSADCAGYGTKKPLPVMKELARVVKRGGQIAILAYSSQQLLPGYPLLEAKLNATAAGIAPFTQGMQPEQHFSRALGWFRAVGLTELNAQTLVATVHAPLSEETRDALVELIDMRWGGSEAELTREDGETYRRLCRPESDEFILNREHYYGFFTYSLFRGKFA